jgi:DNA-binding NtrC family response regulator
MMKNKIAKILVVDDDQNLVNLVKFYLQSENYMIDYTKSSRKALSMIIKNNYDLVLADKQMPEMDGHTLLKIVKKELKINVAFIIITAYGHIEENLPLINDGAYDIIQKPFVSTRLKLTVKNALNYKFLWDEYNKIITDR